MRSGVLFALISAATFGVSGPFAKSLIEAGWSPTAAAFARITGGALVMIAIAALTQRTRIRSALRARRTGAVRSIAVYGVVAIAGVQVCFFNAVQHLSVGIALLLEYLALVLVVGWMWLARSTPPSALTASGGALALVGAVGVLDLFGTTRVSWIGVAWALAAAVCLAVYFVVSENTSEHLSPVLLAAGGLTVAAVLIAVLGAIGIVPLVFTDSPAVMAGATVPAITAVAVLVLVSTVAAYLTGIGAISRLGPTLGSIVSLMEVLFAVIAAWLLLGESVSAVQYLGGAGILAGLVLARVGQRTSAPHPDGSPQQQPPEADGMSPRTSRVA
ncbi:EamA family transporter [Rhodococcoides yunnanense]|uniref:EamA family transporter n=1 Tax=Rhodococcoides yunnanense TaxID=278209 RepID=UPI0009337743|nr:DMT family transporter [Rhodococcus yunnanensis]